MPVSWVWFGENPPVVQFSAQPQLGVTPPVGRDGGTEDERGSEMGGKWEDFWNISVNRWERMGAISHLGRPLPLWFALGFTCLPSASLLTRQHLLLSSPPLRLPGPPNACC